MSENEERIPLPVLLVFPFLEVYISNIKLSDFNVEQTLEKKFCETFIVSF
jgi:hypothetical protein